jgi:ankyrin repeat protein
MGGYADVATVLLDSEADSGVENVDGATALQAAALYGHTAVVAALLQGAKSAKREDIARDIARALRGAVQRRRNTWVLKLLLEYGPDEVNSKSRSPPESTPLFHMMQSGGDIDAAKLLLQAHADVNIASNNGATPLLCAVIRKPQERLEWVQLLIDARADVNAANKNGFTPLSIARQFGPRSVVDLLQDSGALA